MDRKFLHGGVSSSSGQAEMSERLIDTHCHVSAYPDPIGVLVGATAAKVSVVIVTEEPGQYRLLRTRIGHRPGVDLALGLHPLRAAELGGNDVARLFRLLPQARWLGEVGLDFSPAGAPTRRAQLRLFDMLLAEPTVCALPMTVHSRGAAKETVKHLLDAKARAILHWYTGPLAVAEEALAAGLYFSINHAMLTSTRGAALIKLLPPDRILLETDGPYTRSGSQPAQPKDLPSIVELLATRWSRTVADARALIVHNQQRYLGGQ